MVQHRAAAWHPWRHPTGRVLDGVACRLTVGGRRMIPSGNDPVTIPCPVCATPFAPAAKSSASRTAPTVSITRWPTGTDLGSVRRSWARASSALRAGKTTRNGAGGGATAVPHTDVRPDPPSAPVAGDGGWYNVPLPRRRASGRTRGGAGRTADQDVRIGGGPTTMRASIGAGLVDHLHKVSSEATRGASDIPAATAG